MISFYMDEHVPKAITNGLRLRGIDVLTVQEDGRTGIADNLVFDRAIELQRILFTQDEIDRMRWYHQRSRRITTR